MAVLMCTHVHICDRACLHAVAFMDSLSDPPRAVHLLFQGPMQCPDLYFEVHVKTLGFTLWVCATSNATVHVPVMHSSCCSLRDPNCIMSLEVFVRIATGVLMSAHVKHGSTQMKYHSYYCLMFP